MNVSGRRVGARVGVDVSDGRDRRGRRSRTAPAPSPSTRGRARRRRRRTQAEDLHAQRDQQDGSAGLHGDVQGRQLPGQARVDPSGKPTGKTAWRFSGFTPGQADLRPRQARRQGLHAARGQGRRVAVRHAEHAHPPPARRGRRTRSRYGTYKVFVDNRRQVQADGGLAVLRHDHDLPASYALGATARRRAASSSSTPSGGSGRASRKPWASGQPSSARKRALRLGLDALGDRGAAERARQVAGWRSRYADASRLSGHLAQEGAVDLERLHRHLAQARQRRVARAEVVERELQARGVQRAQDRARDSAGSSIVADSVSSTVRRRGVGARARAGGAATRSAKSSRRSWRGETLKEICGSQPARGPGDLLLADRADDPVADRLDQPGLLGERDEVARRDDAALGVVPAQQRLDADQLARATSKIGW